MSDEIAVYCRNGHYIGIMPDDYYRGISHGRMRQMMEQQYAREVEQQNFCQRCGAESMIACLHCETVILREDKRPDYCGKCGKAFPWRDREIAEDRKDDDDVFGPLER